MTTWHATVDVDAIGLEQLAAITEQLPGYGTIVHNATTGRTALAMQLDAATLRQAADAALKAVRDAGTAVLGQPLTASAMRILPDAVRAVELQHPPTLDLVGQAEAAKILGVSGQRVDELARTHADFPQPVAQLAMGRVWTRASIEAFNEHWERRRTGRPRKHA